jgi:hypothetical protein
MKTAADLEKTPDTDFYLATLAPVSHERERCFRPTDALVLCVLFVEVLFVARLVLAN